MVGLSSVELFEERGGLVPSLASDRGVGRLTGGAVERGGHLACGLLALFHRPGRVLDDPATGGEIGVELIGLGRSEGEQEEGRESDRQSVALAGSRWVDGRGSILGRDNGVSIDGPSWPMVHEKLVCLIKAALEPGGRLPQAL